MTQKPRPFYARYPHLPPDATRLNTVDFFHETLRRRWPTLGLHAWVQEATFGKGRMVVGPIDSPFGDATY
jgi:hypothetical protein